MAAGCSHPQPALEAGLPNVDPEAVAARALETEDFALAATQYETLAHQSGSPAAAEFALRAALVRSDLGEPPPEPMKGDGIRASLLEALRTKSADNVLQRLNGEKTRELSLYEQGLFLRTLGRAQLAKHDPLPAAINLTLAERSPLPAGRRAELTQLIWDALTQAGSKALANRLRETAPHARGWLALLEAREAAGRDSRQLAMALTEWQAEFPRHPANGLLVETLLEQAAQANATPRRIGLLLPADGPLADIAAAIRDGFIAARMDLPAAQRPDVVIYPARATTLATQLEQARQDGIELLVGPLAKADVDALATRLDIPFPVLALNQATRAPAAPGRFLQFALDPEDEARDAAERAWQDGARRIAVLASNNGLGGRQLQAFRTRWEALGGTLVATSRYGRDPNAYAGAVASTLGLEEGKARASALKALLRRDIAFEPAPRDDIDAAYLAGGVQDAHQILPQFQYFGAEKLRIYASPAIAEGLAGTRVDQDLEGMRSGGPAWATGVPVQKELREMFERYWPDSPQWQRFRAFGADALLIASQSIAMRADHRISFEGASGRLSLDESGVIHRRLYWADIHDGKPVPLEQSAVAP